MAQTVLIISHITGKMLNKRIYIQLYCFIIITEYIFTFFTDITYIFPLHIVPTQPTNVHTMYIEYYTIVYSLYTNVIHNIDRS